MNIGKGLGFRFREGYIRGLFRDYSEDPLTQSSWSTSKLMKHSSTGKLYHEPWKGAYAS